MQRADSRPDIDGEQRRHRPTGSKQPRTVTPQRRAWLWRPRCDEAAATCQAQIQGQQHLAALVTPDNAPELQRLREAVQALRRHRCERKLLLLLAVEAEELASDTQSRRQVHGARWTKEVNPFQ